MGIMKEISVKALAKINLGLDVVRRREDGYHEVKMVMQTIHLFDRLEMKKTAGGITMTTNLSFLPTNENNLVYKAAKLLWFCDQYRTFYHRWKCGKLFTNSFCKCGSTHNAVRNICTDLNPTLHQFFFGQSKFKHTVHTIKYRCSICTSTGHSRCDRNILAASHRYRP